MSAVKMRYDIQGLRAVAVLVVMLFHYNADWMPGGFVGVDIFMVISGYLITLILLRSKEGDGNLFGKIKRFYSSRIRRIAPAYYALLLVVTIAAIILLTPADFSYYFDSFKDALVFISNQYFAGFGSYFAPDADQLPLLHTWSLAIEMQFYLFAPLAILLLPTKALKITTPVFIAACILLAEYMMRHGGGGGRNAAYFALYARMPEFALGGFIALFAGARLNNEKINTCLALLGTALITASVFLIDGDSLFPGLLCLVPCVGAVLIIQSNDHGIVGKILSRPSLVFVGAISYSLYLWHWPILAFTRYYSGQYTLGISTTIFFVIATFVLSCTSYYLVETPFRTRWKGRKPVYATAAIAVIVLAGFSQQGLALNKHVIKPLPVEYTRYADNDKICHGHIVGSCIRGDTTKPPSILVLGDSHAAMLNLFFDRLGKEHGFSARILTASSCVPIPGFDYKRISRWAWAPCQKMIKHVMEYVPKASQIVVAGVWKTDIKSQVFRKALKHFLAKRPKATTIYLLADIPRFSVNPRRWRRFKQLGLPLLAPERTNESVKANQYVESLAAKYDNVVYLSYACTDIFQSAPFFKGKLIYMDQHHLNEIGAKLYAEAMDHVITDVLFGKSSEGIGNGAGSVGDYGAERCTISSPSLQPQLEPL